MAGIPKRIFVIPDTQVRPGEPQDHLDWIAQAIPEYAPDVVIHLGDHFDFPSLSSHEQPGSVLMEGTRFTRDLEAGNEAFARLSGPMDAEIRRTSKLKNPWKPRKIVTLGNHEDRADRVAMQNPRLLGVVGSELCDFRDWHVHPFLEIVEVEGFLVSHYFQNSHSGRPIGGTVQNKLSRIGASHINGHVQGLDMGTKIMGSGKTYWGFQAGSAYTHIEFYRGAQSQRHFRGVLVLNEVEDGDCCPMPLSLDYLCRKYEGLRLAEFMAKKYPWGCWGHLWGNANHSRSGSGRKLIDVAKMNAGSGKPVRPTDTVKSGLGQERASPKRRAA